MSVTSEFGILTCLFQEQLTCGFNVVRHEFVAADVGGRHWVYVVLLMFINFHKEHTYRLCLAY